MRSECRSGWTTQLLPSFTRIEERVANTVLLGQPSPLGAALANGGANFSLFSRTAMGVELLLFDCEDDSQPSRALAFDPVANRTYHYWHLFVPGVRAGQIYAYRVHSMSPCFAPPFEAALARQSDCIQTRQGRSRAAS